MTQIHKHNNEYNPWADKRFAIYSTQVNIETGEESEDTFIEEVAIQSRDEFSRLSQDIASKNSFSKAYAEQENREFYTRKYLRELISHEQEN